MVVEERIRRSEVADHGLVAGFEQRAVKQEKLPFGSPSTETIDDVKDSHRGGRRIAEFRSSVELRNDAIHRARVVGERADDADAQVVHAIAVDVAEVHAVVVGADAILDRAVHP